jgi:hypothetical protein
MNDDASAEKRGLELSLRIEKQLVAVQIGFMATCGAALPSLLEIRSSIRPPDSLPLVLIIASSALMLGLLLALARALMGYSAILFMTTAQCVPIGHKINRGAPWLVGQSAAVLVCVGYTATAYHFCPWLSVTVLVTAVALYVAVLRHARGLRG